MKNYDQNREGILVWITGLPGSGKTTLANEVYNLIKDIIPSVRMDGDVFREIMGNDLGYTVEDRKANAFRLARMNKYLVDHGIVVVCATVSLYKEVHVWNKTNIRNLIEVFIKVPPKVLRQRDQKNMYSGALKGRIDNVIGIHQTFDIPENPDMVIFNKKSLTEFLENTQKIKNLVLKKYNNLPTYGPDGQ